jgi:acyl-CoA thioesterase FadM
MPEKVAVTAKLSIDYRAPTRADQFVRIRTRIAEKNGRKMKVLATIEAMDGSVLCEAE